jgi:hypothetical protein
LAQVSERSQHPIVPHCYPEPDSALQHNVRLYPSCIFRQPTAAQQETTMQTIVLYNGAVRRSTMRSAWQNAGNDLSSKPGRRASFLVNEDREETADSVERLMGTKAEARFDFTQERAEFASAEELDI